MDDLLTDFLADLKKQIPALQALLTPAKADADQITALLTTLREEAALIGLMNMELLLQAMENACQTGVTEALPALQAGLQELQQHGASLQKTGAEKDSNSKDVMTALRARLVKPKAVKTETTAKPTPQTLVPNANQSANQKLAILIFEAQGEKIAMPAPSILRVEKTMMPTTDGQVYTFGEMDIPLFSPLDKPEASDGQTSHILICQCAGTVFALQAGSIHQKKTVSGSLPSAEDLDTESGAERFLAKLVLGTDKIPLLNPAYFLQRGQRRQPALLHAQQQPTRGTKKQAEPSYQTATPHTPTPAIRRVLLVDDSAFFRNLLAPVLATAGYEVVTAETQNEALQLLQKEQKFDAVISDMDMPLIEGHSLAQSMGANDNLCHIPMVGLSSSRQPDEAPSLGTHLNLRPVLKHDQQAVLDTLQEMLANQSAPQAEQDTPRQRAEA